MSRSSTWPGTASSKVKIAAMAEAYEVNFAPHNFYGHLATMISAHFCAAIANFRIMEIDIDDVPWKDEVVTRRRSRTAICPADAPGWGAEVNEADPRPPAEALSARASHRRWAGRLSVGRRSLLASVAVLLAVPIAVLGTVGALNLAGVASRAAWCSPIALADKNAILVVAYARQPKGQGGPRGSRCGGRSGAAALPDPDDLVRVHPARAAAGARDRRRRQCAPLDRHHGRGAGMLASTCIAVLFVPSFFVVLQRLSERRRRKAAAAVAATPKAD